MFTDGVLVTLPVLEIVVNVFIVPVGDHGAQIVGRVVDVVLPGIVVPVGDGGQVRVLKVALTRIHCSNVGQLIAPDLQRITCIGLQCTGILEIHEKLRD